MKIIVYFKFTLPFSKASICVAVKDVRLRCNFLLRRMRNCSSASPFCPSLLLLSELECTPSISVRKYSFVLTVSMVMIING